MSLRAIAKKLDRIGAPRPSQKQEGPLRWYAGTIQRMLLNEIYVGRLYYGKVRQINGERTKQPREKWIQIDVPELVVIDQEPLMQLKIG